MCGFPATRPPVSTPQLQICNPVMNNTTPASNGALPEHLSPSVKKALREARERLANIYADRLQHVILYGSRARGDAREDSDVDVLVVLRGPIKNRYHEIKRAGAFWGEFLTRYGLSFSVKPYAEAEYQDLARPFIRNIHEEGIEL